VEGENILVEDQGGACYRLHFFWYWV